MQMHNNAAHTASFAGWTRGKAARLWPQRYGAIGDLSSTYSGTLRESSEST